jgi:hypothetical protein
MREQPLKAIVSDTWLSLVCGKQAYKVAANNFEDQFIEILIFAIKPNR